MSSLLRTFVSSPGKGRGQKEVFKASFLITFIMRSFSYLLYNLPYHPFPNFGLLKGKLDKLNNTMCMQRAQKYIGNENYQCQKS